ncbi:hypothetical protein BH18ACT4_BH18ACT4_08050 [soil metagenome]
MGRRVAAYVIDSVIGMAIYFGLVVALAEDSGEAADDAFKLATEVTSDGTLVQLGRTIYELDTGRLWLVILATLAYAAVVYVVLHGLTGATPGNAAVGIRAVKDDGRAPGLGKAFIRWVLFVVDGFPYVIPMLVGFVVAMTSPERRRVGDRAAGTWVVARSAVGRPVATAAPSQPYGGYGYQPGPAAGYPQAPLAQQPWASTPAPAATVPAADEPRWDDARGTYIRWDAVQQRWFEWREAEQRWDAIE